ncbi:hypothetical protein ACFFR3_35370 [Nonomuraea salmonea]|uniref:Secreted protein n=1 Tax=Nonomuraea salmonea TaxID=46181 RepID=A0ABV5NWX8_9ACTN
MNVRTWRAKAGALTAALLLTSAGLSLATASSATASSGKCEVVGWPYNAGRAAQAVNRCSGTASEKLYAKFVWNNGPDSICLTFRPGQIWKHDRPVAWAEFESMKYC